MVRIALIGCTGSIGMQVAQVVRSYPERFRLTALACGRGGAAFKALLAEFLPAVALCAEGTFDAPEKVAKLAAGEEARLFEDCDVAFIAAGGSAGLKYTLLAAEAGKKILGGSGLNITAAEDMADGAEKACRLAKEAQG